MKTEKKGGDRMMSEQDRIDKINEIDKELQQLPIGYISKKNINGKERFYHQWTEDGKVKSRYLKGGELEPLQEQIARRKELAAEKKQLQILVPKVGDKQIDTELNVVTGAQLREFVKGVEQWEKRDCYADLEQYLYSGESDRVCLVYGLRRTGKTTMLRQAIAQMSAEQLAQTAYLKARKRDTMAMVNRDLKKLQKANIHYVFIDEVTLISDFIDSAALFSDVFASMGMKIVLSGTNSLGFWLTMDEELYDRAKLIHTTYIPYREHSRLLGIDSIDEYIRYGGTLRAGEIAFDDAELNTDEASFRDDESTRRYIDTAICRNIQHSLACYEDGNHFRHLYSLYEKHELTGAINRIIEDMNHRFVLQVLTKDFVSGDLRLTARNLRKERDLEKRTDALDLIVDCPIEIAGPGIAALEHVLFTQPGMRYCQAQALVHSLMKDETFLMLSEQKKTMISERILEEVRGRMMKDIILLETAKALGSRYKMFKYQFDRGEFDMVVYDSEENTCRAYEIKHSKEAVPEQGRHLLDEEKVKQTEQRFGKMVGRYVIYRGPDFIMENGIEYKNTEEYLKNLAK